MSFIPFSPKDSDDMMCDQPPLYEVTLFGQVVLVFYPISKYIMLFANLFFIQKKVIIL